MLNPFPDLLPYTFYAPAILRVAVALLFFYAAIATYRSLGATASSGAAGGRLWRAYVAAALETAVGALLLAGFMVQIAALFGMAFAVIFFVLKDRREAGAPFSRETSFLIFFALLSLLITGAGAYAIDIPL